MPLAPSSKITFHFLEKRIPLQDRTKLKKFIARVFGNEGHQLERLSYIFCSDEFLLKMNRDYLAHDYYTDIITFDMSESERIVGEVYISVDRVRENAATFKTTAKRELHRVIFHGALHLCGYKDKTKGDQAEMRGKEDVLLKRYFK